MDAVRMPDGKIVMLKAISKERFLFELEIGQFFSMQPQARSEESLHPASGGIARSGRQGHRYPDYRDAEDDSHGAA
jgi:hypothetical protein